MKTAIVIAAGLGDGLLHLPLIHALRLQGHTVSLFSETAAFNVKLLKSEKFDQLVQLSDRASFVAYGLKNFKKHDRVLLNHLCQGRRHGILAGMIGREVVKNFVLKTDNQHDTLTNLDFAHTTSREVGEFDYVGELLNLPKTTAAPGLAVQMFAGSGVNTYKNWCAEKWHSLLGEVVKIFPGEKIYLLGTKEESLAWEKLPALGESVVNLMGKTSVAEALSIVHSSKAFLGVDGGLYHAAALSGVATFSLWGPSDPKLYAYDQFNPKTHPKLSLNLSCSPCNAWSHPNRSRVSSPFDCPDKMCMRDISVEQVQVELIPFLRGTLCAE